MPVEAIVQVLLGAGMVGMITAVVSAIRRLRSGKINDDDSVIARLYREIERREKAQQATESDRDLYAAIAASYRRQLVAYGRDPNPHYGEGKRGKDRDDTDS